MEFYKMQGCGNDFVVIQDLKLSDYHDVAIQLCDRKLGIGADGLIVVKTNPFEMIFYNQDGSKASMCGNGIRCFARYVYEKGLLKKNQFECITQAGKIQLEIVTVTPFVVRVGMGKPNYQNTMIRVADHIDSFGRILSIGPYHLTIYSFFLGTIHTVLFVESLEAEVLNLASDICHNTLFKAQTNVHFVHVLDDHHLEMRSYERGVGWTLACGTGACASVVTAKRLGLVKGKVTVHLALGTLEVEIDKKDNVYLEGEASVSYIGETKECWKC